MDTRPSQTRAGTRARNRADPVQALSPAARRVRSEFHEFGLARGRPVGSRSASVVLRAGIWLTGRPPAEWSNEEMVALAWYGVVAWCRTSDLAVPSDAAAAVRAYGDYLDPDGTRGLAAAVAEVVDPVGLQARRKRPA